jgi:hypothetical protein
VRDREWKSRNGNFNLFHEQIFLASIPWWKKVSHIHTTFDNDNSLSHSQIGCCLRDQLRELFFHHPHLHTWRRFTIIIIHTGARVPINIILQSTLHAYLNLSHSIFPSLTHSHSEDFYYTLCIKKSSDVWDENRIWICRWMFSNNNWIAI